MSVTWRVFWATDVWIPTLDIPEHGFHCMGDVHEQGRLFYAQQFLIVFLGNKKIIIQ